MNNNQSKGFVMPTTGTQSTFVFGTGKNTFPTTQTQQFVFPASQQTTLPSTFKTSLPQPTFPATQPAPQSTTASQSTFPTTFGPSTQTAPQPAPQSTFPTTFGPSTQTAPQSTFGPTTQPAPQSTFPTTFGPSTQTAPQSTFPTTFGPSTQTAPQSTFPTTFGPSTQPAPQSTFPTTFGPSTQPAPQSTFPTTFGPSTQPAPVAQETKSTQIPTTTQSEIEEYLFSERYNKDSVFKSDRTIHINTGLKIFTFQFDSKIKNNMYKLKEKNSEIEIVIRFESKNPEFSEAEIRTLKIRPVGKTLFNHYKNKYEHCSFIEPCDGTIYNYFTKIKELIGQREFGSLKLDIPKIFQIVEQLRKNMVSLFELNNQYVYTNLTLDNIVYKCKNNNLNETEFKLILDYNIFPIDGVNKYISSYPPYEMKSGILVLDTKEKKEQTLSWYIGILLLMFVARHIPSFNSLNWIINDVSAVDYNNLKFVISSFYGEEYSNYLTDIPSARPSIYTSIQ